MADGRHALQWTGYGSLESVLDFRDLAPRTTSPCPSFVQTPQSIPKTPPGWQSPYCVSSPSEPLSPLTPTTSFTLYSPIAFHPSQLASCPSPASPRSICSSPLVRIMTPPMPLSPPHVTSNSVAPLPGPVVPQRAYKATVPLTGEPMQIQFNSADGICGIPMRLLKDASAMDLPMENGRSVPFPASVASTITLRIWWPGYVQYSRRMTMRKATGLLMRCELAMAVSEVYKQFIEEAREDARDCGQAKWRVGRGRITVDDLVLLRMFQVSQGSWQADVRLEKEQ
ncbi:SubName: Full=Uncharacterized protein {ECO:0000313/EMBL:CCA69866.1} [Serendipita indica DSM 11827]|nr:SubName: Full=Uncharacterized protein {ECO:0000313/EMBL:CCA69866.1} [Serendipita indica DSM 11827]